MFVGSDDGGSSSYRQCGKANSPATSATAWNFGCLVALADECGIRQEQSILVIICIQVWNTIDN
jgi:hypothetical protein